MRTVMLEIEVRTRGLWLVNLARPFVGVLALVSYPAAVRIGNWALSHLALESRTSSSRDWQPIELPELRLDA